MGKYNWITLFSCGLGYSGSWCAYTGTLSIDTKDGRVTRLHPSTPLKRCRVHDFLTYHDMKRMFGENVAPLNVHGSWCQKCGVLQSNSTTWTPAPLKTIRQKQAPLLQKRKALLKTLSALDNQQRKAQIALDRIDEKLEQIEYSYEKGK